MMQYDPHRYPQYISRRALRVRRQEVVWTVVIVVMATPIILALVLVTAMSLAGCANPGVVCNLPF